MTMKSLISLIGRPNRQIDEKSGRTRRALSPTFMSSTNKSNNNNNSSNFSMTKAPASMPPRRFVSPCSSSPSLRQMKTTTNRRLVVTSSMLIKSLTLILISSLLYTYWSVVVFTTTSSTITQQSRRAASAGTPTNAIFMPYFERPPAGDGGVDTTTRADSELRQNQQQEWYNQHDLVHVVQTRFMQYQPRLTNLGKARLEIFKHVTLPSLLNQMNCQFLWMIRIDPNLDEKIRSDMLKTVDEAVRVSESTLNVVVLASNENPEGFRTVKYAPDYEEVIVVKGGDKASRSLKPLPPTKLIYGSWELLRSYREASQTRLMLETRLDADDALSLDFVMRLQQDAASSGDLTRPAELSDSSQHHSKEPTPYYKVYCVSSHLEWQHYNPWLLAKHPLQPSTPGNNISSSGNSTSIVDQKNDDADLRGALLGLRSKHCVTSGLTIAYPVGVTRKDLKHPKNHHQIHTKLKRCRQKTEQQSQQHPAACLHYLYRPKIGAPMALRTRTITSAGMANLVLGGQKQDFVDQYLQHSAFQTLQDGLFQHLPSLFGVYESDVVAVRASIEANRQLILEDAIKGQCTHGHSCKATSRLALRALLNATSSTTTN